MGGTDIGDIIFANRTPETELAEVRLQLLSSYEFFSLMHSELDRRIGYDMSLVDYNKFIDMLTDLYDHKRRNTPDISTVNPQQEVVIDTVFDQWEIEKNTQQL